MAFQRWAETRESDSKSRLLQEPQSCVVATPKPHPLMQLQRTLGNRAVQRLLAGRLGDAQRAAAMAPEEGEELPVAEEFEAGLGQRQGQGRPLPERARAFLEPRLGIDLSPVRVHTGREAHELAGAVGATAFTTGTDIFFRDGAYSPQSSEGLRLLTHEVTHVLQQSRGPV